MKSKLWVEKYRPKIFADYVFHNKQYETVFRQMVVGREVPNLLLSGTPGSGKTSLVGILLNELNIDVDFDVLSINASDENSIDVIREKIKAFIEVRPFGKHKIVVLEEGDYISKNGQAALRHMMEEYVDTVRFIITCNYQDRLLPAIKSRCQHFHFDSFPKKQLLEYVVDILDKENVSFADNEVLECVNKGYPDVRKILNTLQQYTVRGTFVPPDNVQTDNNDNWMELLENGDWDNLRTAITTTVMQEEWLSVYQFFYTNLHKSIRFSERVQWERAIILIAEYLYKHSFVADPEINFSAMIFNLKALQR